jgi:hypothetical protein
MDTATAPIVKVSSLPIDGQPSQDGAVGFSKTTLNQDTLQSLQIEQQEWRRRFKRVEWEETMCEVLGIPPGYSEVDVMLIRWADEISETKLKARQESARIETIFRDQFNFNVTPVVLDANQPEKTLQYQVLKKCEKTRQSSLLIMYYNGHGNRKLEPQQLMFAA